MLNAFSDLLCSKLCWHNRLVPNPKFDYWIFVRYVVFLVTSLAGWFGMVRVTCMNIPAYLYAITHTTHAHKHTRMHVHTSHIHTHVCTHTHTRAHTQTHTRVHTHTYAQTHTQYNIIITIIILSTLDVLSRQLANG